MPIQSVSSDSTHTSHSPLKVTEGKLSDLAASHERVCGFGGRLSAVGLRGLFMWINFFLSRNQATKPVRIGRKLPLLRCPWIWDTIVNDGTSRSVPINLISKRNLSSHSLSVPCFIVQRLLFFRKSALF